MKNALIVSIILFLLCASFALCAWTHRENRRLVFDANLNARRLVDWQRNDEWRDEQKRKEALREAAEEEKRAKLHAEPQAKKEAAE